MRRCRFAKVVAIVLVVSVGSVFSAGCFGKFQLTRKLYEINQSIEEKYVRSAVTWLLLVPYAFAGFLDFAVFNLIEFWSGENPVAGVSQTRVYERGDDRAVMTISRKDGATVATIEKYRAGVLVSTLRMRDDGDGSVRAELVEDGKATRHMTSAPGPDGSVVVETVSASGTASKRIPPAALETYLARASRVAAEVRDALASAGSAPCAAAARVPALQG